MQFGIGQSLAQLRHLGLVDFGDVGVNVRNVLGRLFHARQDVRLLAFQFLHPILHGRLIHAVLDRRHHAGDAAFDLLQRLAVKLYLCSAFTVLTVERFGIGTHGLGDPVGRNQPFGKAGENTLLDVIATDGMAVVAGPPAIAIEAAIPVTGDDAVIAAAAAAFE